MTWTSVSDPSYTTTVRHRFVDDNTAEWDIVVKDGTGKVFFRQDGKSVRAKEPKK
jgi:hypothetical protein